MKKKVLVFLMILTMGILSGCGMSEEEASEYVKATLDAVYKGEFDAFVEITDSTPEGAKAMYVQNIEQTMEAAGFHSQDISDELSEKYRQLFYDISKEVDYTVTDAVENSEGEFEVSVEIYPLTIISEITEEDVTDALVSEIDQMKKYPSDQKITELTFEIIYDMLSDKVKEPSYDGRKITQIVTIHKNDNGKYYISEEDMLAMDSALFNQHKK